MDIGKIANIYQNTHYGYDYSIDIFDIKNDAIKFIVCILLFKLCIFGFLDILLATYVNIIIINKNWQFTYIKNIFGERIHHYLKMVRFGSKSNNLFIKIILISIIIVCIFCIFGELFFINYIDIITKDFLDTLKLEGIIK